jgi:molecular chaperone DnaK (HSP70)
VKIPELLNDVTLKVIIERTELDEAAMSIYERVAEPAIEALKKAGLKSSDID